MFLAETSNQQRSFEIPEQLFQKSLALLAKKYHVKCSACLVVFASRQKIQALHKQFFNDPTLTDCMTFPCDSPDEKGGFLGEIYVCPYTASAYVKKHGGSFNDELLLYAVHGFLHLIGMKDDTPAAQEAMRAEEIVALDFLKKSKSI